MLGRFDLFLFLPDLEDTDFENLQATKANAETRGLAKLFSLPSAGQDAAFKAAIMVIKF